MLGLSHVSAWHTASVPSYSDASRKPEQTAACIYRQGTAVPQYRNSILPRTIFILFLFLGGFARCGERLKALPLESATF